MIENINTVESDLLTHPPPAPSWMLKNQCSSQQLAFPAKLHLSRMRIKSVRGRYICRSTCRIPISLRSYAHWAAHGPSVHEARRDHPKVLGKQRSVWCILCFAGHCCSSFSSLRYAIVSRPVDIHFAMPINKEKLEKLQSARIGGKGTSRRKKKIVHKTATDDKKVQVSRPDL